MSKYSSSSCKSIFKTNDKRSRRVQSHAYNEKNTKIVNASSVWFLNAYYLFEMDGPTISQLSPWITYFFPDRTDSENMLGMLYWVGYPSFPATFLWHPSPLSSFRALSRLVLFSRMQNNGLFDGIRWSSIAALLIIMAIMNAEFSAAIWCSIRIMRKLRFDCFFESEILN